MLERWNDRYGATSQNMSQTGQTATREVAYNALGERASKPPKLPAKTKNEEGTMKEPGNTPLCPVSAL